MKNNKQDKENDSTINPLFIRLLGFKLENGWENKKRHLFTQMPLKNYFTLAKACFKSSKISLISSSPTEKRTIPLLIPAASSCSSVN